MKVFTPLEIEAIGKAKVKEIRKLMQRNKKNEALIKSSELKEFLTAEIKKLKIRHQ